MTPTAQKNDEQKVTKVFVNEKPEVPAETEHVSYVIKEVSRTVKTVEGETESIKYVLQPTAKTIPGAVSLTENDEAKMLGYFNAGLFAAIRTKASNDLSGGSDEDRAFAKIVKVVAKLPMFAGKTEDEITSTLRDNPALMTLFAK